jgi:hypothetical protein
MSDAPTIDPRAAALRGRAAFVVAMQENRELLARIAAENPQVLAALTKALVAVEAARAKRKLKDTLE